MSDALNTVTKTVREVICRENLPLGGANMLRLVLGDPVRCEVPHLRIAALDVLLHSQKSLLWFILPVSHIAELGKICLDVLLGMLAAIPGAFFAIFSATLQLDVGLDAVADVCLALISNLFGQVVKPLKVVARIRDGIWGEACDGKVVVSMTLTLLVVVLTD